MEKYNHNKLVRDRIPEIIKESGNTYEARVLDDVEYEKELKKKLVEESKEVSKASQGKILNELADVLQLIKSISSHYKISFSEVVRNQIEKKKKRGAFSKKIFLIWSTQPKG